MKRSTTCPSRYLIDYGETSLLQFFPNLYDLVVLRLSMMFLYLMTILMTLALPLSIPHVSMCFSSIFLDHSYISHEVAFTLYLQCLIPVSPLETKKQYNDRTDS